MDLYQSTSEFRQPSRHNHTLNAIVDFRYLAPAKLGRDDAHERMRAEAARRQLGKGDEPANRRRRLMAMARHRLGGIFILIGTSLQEAHAGATSVRAASDPGPATT